MFVHGLGGDAQGTWGDMITLCLDDPGLDHVTFDCYAYPTALWRNPFNARTPRIQQLAGGLKTVIDIYYPEYTNIILVSHSLGGLIARQYILSEVKSRNKLKVKKAVFYATPHTGASLAAVGSVLSWNHYHLKQLCARSDFLNGLNEDWQTFQVQSMIATSYIAGGLDQVVHEESAIPHYGKETSSTIINADHRSIIKPTSSYDQSIWLLKTIIGTKIRPIESVTQVPIITPGNPLFDIYSLQHDEFYVVRKIDDNLSRFSIGNHLWISGPSGVGKTSAVRRHILKSTPGQNFYHLSLGSYEITKPDDVVRAIVAELAEICGNRCLVSTRSSFVDLIREFREILRQQSASHDVSLLIEEIRFNENCSISDFIPHLGNILASIETDNSINSKVHLFITTISNPTDNFPQKNAKLRERVHFLELPIWEDEEIITLLKLLAASYPGMLNASDETIATNAAAGLPRYIKALYRRLISPAFRPADLSILIQQVAREQV